MSKPDLSVLTNGLGGVSGNGLSSNNTTFHSTMYDMHIEHYYDRVIEGGFVIKKAHLIRDNPMLVWNCPLVGLELTETRSCPVPDAGMAMQLQGEFQTLAVMKIAKPQWSGMDRVPLPDYVEYWRQAGATIGMRVGDHIEWEDGTSVLAEGR